MASQAALSSRQRAVAVCGVVYVLLSLVGGVWYLRLLGPSFANDLWWAHYNISGHQAYLVDLVNQLLLTHDNGTVDPFAAAAVLPKTYLSPESSTHVFSSDIRAFTLGRLTSLEYAVPQLRDLGAYWALRMNTQHCWMDFNKTFQVAHTLGRQRRCERFYATNGAVFIEAMLRNQNIPDFLALWGVTGQRFNVAYYRGLVETARGQAFWAQVTSVTTSVIDEIAYWRSFNVSHFALQWQNRWGPSITETIVMENALGMQKQIILKALDQVTGPWSSQTMHWIPIQDTFNAQAMNRSFLQGTSRYFGANNSALGLSAISLEVYRGIADAQGNLEGVARVFHDTIGPYLSIDLRLCLPPASLVGLYNHFQQVVMDHVRGSEAAMTAFLALPETTTFLPTPLAWTNMTFFGGNPMCSSGVPTPFVQQSFDFYDTCAQLAPLSLRLTRLSMLFGLLVTPRTALPDICATTSTPNWCALSPASSLLASVSIPSEMLRLQRDAFNDVRAMNVGLVQFVAAGNSSHIALDHVPLVDWPFFGHHIVFEWAAGLREVLFIEGDVGAVTVVSNAYAGQPYITSNTSFETATTALLYLVQVTTGLLLFVGVLTMVYVTLFARGRVLGLNLFRFNRLVGAVWIGRPLVVLRGISALLLLSSAQVSLQVTPLGTTLAPHPRSIGNAMVIAGEATWLTYVINDVLIVLLPRDVTTQYSPRSTCLVWLSLVVLEMASPVPLTITLDRQCVGNDMDYGLLCTSGVISVGSYTRLLTLISIHVSVVIITVVASLLGRRRPPADVDTEPSLHFSSATALFATPMAADFDGATFDLVTCVLCGLVPVWFQSESYVFNLKLWHFVADCTQKARHLKVFRPPSINAYTMIHVAGPRKEEIRATLKKPSKILWMTKQRSNRLVAFLALGHTVFAVVSSVSYFQVSQVHLANDYYWANFNVTGAHAFFANWLNEQLVLGLSTTALELDAPSITLPGAFAAPSAAVSAPNNYGAMLQHTQLTTIEVAIAGLRASDACMAPWIFSPYCFLDFDRTFEVAYSTARQARCHASMRANGAVYLESLLRNIDFRDWTACWGSAFETAFARDLRGSVAGQKWLDMVSASPLPLSVEVTYWRQQGVERYDTQWQNYKRIGVMNSYSITNAYGASHPLTLMQLNGAYRVDSQTTYKMYWSLANDLSAIMRNSSGIGGRSLLRSSSHFAFLNTTLQAVLIANGTLTSPLQNGLEVVSQRLGPFGTVDMIYMRVPPLIASYGGSLLCPEFSAPKSVTSGFSSMLAFDLSCIAASPVVSRSILTSQSFIASAILSGLSAATPPVNMSQVCAYDPTSLASCLLTLQQSLDFIQIYMPASHALPVPSTHALVQALDIEFMLYAKVNGSLQLLHTNVLDPADPGFHFYGWTYLYDWVLGRREVISFQGDASRLNLLSDYQLPLAQQVQASNLAANLVLYFRAGVQYVTVMMLLVSAVAVGYMLRSPTCFQGSNLFKLNRVGGLVWVGRPLLFLRSATAICLLCTSGVDLHFSGYLSYFQVEPAPWYKVLLAAWEVSWFVAVVDDILLVATQEYASYFVFPNLLVVCAVVAILSGVSPVAVALHVAPKCVYAEMDFNVVCESANIAIGDPSRFGTLLLIMGTSHIVSYSLAKRMVGPKPSSPVHSLLLSLGARYHFNHTARIVHGVYYLDRASAALNGILTYKLGSTMFAFDIKLWRFFAAPIRNAVDVPGLDQATLNASFPLAE
ncbi:hypothetical protein SPRG_11877 [Saprolegnia parasitica CBS 223.65]|uniref:Uncharacterized protein n=1 Tax=Saprolegnia parasitica (strain CBS 223.65) TaxID=695850 RepID=A0A067C1M2_SAPPC|nr:hypothetical protein SPRG_11877 [Saprolegnia parasitica CBS 223.65]KDO23030.1 hypothetical protein SPRG_11877 [Saprolegnia parasitica CBS 223.65]|eukprot:XP_012206318.1 hypothetical protein SPRG_11877 [Saprolegnia parasitica CBS 223.65]